ncbi:redoxin domain-containing protein [Sphingobacterium lactis]|uniref:redoxin domain-containing protein n=1 Tax=Sphingobacterium lactis TaxID=797291 RepID=UPI003F7FB064
MMKFAVKSSLFGALLLSLWSCSNNDTIRVSGEIQNPGNVKVVSFYEGDRKLDSTFIADGNRFKFERPTTQERLLTLQVGNNRYPIILEPGKELIFNVDLQNPDNYVVEGSELTQKLKEFAPLKSRIDFVRDSLQQVFTKATADMGTNDVQNLRSAMLMQFEPYFKDYTHKAVAFANKNNDLSGFYAMTTLDPEMAEAQLIAYSDKIKDQFPDNRYVNDFRVEVDKLKKLAVGQPAPEIIGYTPDNKTVKLSDYKGKIVLVDFWASWCMPCREENPNIVKQFAAFKDKNFTVLGVSLDDNPGSWMRAIEDDKLTWTNISDLKAWSSPLIIDYSIKGIPASYIVDAQGNIIAKNLRGKSLEEFLTKTLN